MGIHANYNRHGGIGIGGPQIGPNDMKLTNAFSSGAFWQKQLRTSSNHQQDG
jgi:hypothetical protein